MQRYSWLLALAALVAAEASAQTVPTYPATPTIVYTTTAGQNATIRWTAPSTNVDGSPITGALTYQVYGSTGPGVPFTLRDTVAATSDLRTSLSAGTPCYYVVAVEAVANAVPSPASSVVCVQVNEAPPPAPQPNAPANVTVGP